jgi:hypothetical protein
MLLAALEVGIAREKAEAERAAGATCHVEPPASGELERSPELPMVLERDEDPEQEDADEVPESREPAEAPAVHPLPLLREDERIGHTSPQGVIVIIRRRRAA